MVMGGRSDMGARIPDHPVVIALLRHCGFPLATTSANPSSKPSAKTAADAYQYFLGKLPLILDAGAAGIGKESTVVDLTHFHGVVVREGCLSSKKLLPYL
jgi:L-threonylcarbamoyladenylate synthase